MKHGARMCGFLVRTGVTERGAHAARVPFSAARRKPRSTNLPRTILSGVKSVKRGVWQAAKLGRPAACAPRLIAFVTLACTLWVTSCASGSHPAAESPLTGPGVPELDARAPDLFDVRLETSKGVILIEVHRDWAPHGADRFYNLVQAGYYDGDRFFRVIAGKWAQFGVNGDPKISNVWRTQTIPDDPRRESNVRGTVAFAFAVPNGRTTQVFINLRDNSATHDPLAFVPFGKVVEGMNVAEALNAEYGETAGSGIRSGKQGPLFAKGNAWLEQSFPRLDYIRRATIAKPSGANER
jgi:cyclophilin family peptidyl-prolyl cis-trans isomerase